jgi:undecaprenyl-diphosphatase
MQRRWLEPLFLSLVIGTTVSLWVFLGVASEVAEGETGSMDAAILLALHPADASGPMIGPRWLWEVARDITGLGSAAVLVLVVLATFVCLLMARRIRTAFFVLAATALGYVASALLKLYFNRPRPALIPHDLHVSTASFPSGHAMLSATVYLTLGAVLANIVATPRLKVFVLCVALFLSTLVGMSRIYLGVHWPTDVLAGWAAGAAWALGAWAIAQAIHIRAGDKP